MTEYCRSDGNFVDHPASLKTSTCMKLFFHAKKKIISAVLSRDITRMCPF